MSSDLWKLKRRLSTMYGWLLSFQRNDTTWVTTINEPGTLNQRSEPQSVRRLSALVDRIYVVLFPEARECPPRISKQPSVHAIQGGCIDRLDISQVAVYYSSLHLTLSTHLRQSMLIMYVTSMQAITTSPVPRPVHTPSKPMPAGPSSSHMARGTAPR